MSRLPSADLIWNEDGNPASARFGDIYYSREDGIAETRHVFLEGNGLPDLWTETDRPHFTIGETGFGTGLNFLCTWAAWRETARSDQWLHFLSVEGYPLTREQLARALGQWPALSDLAEQLIAAYPAPHRGTHQIVFDAERVSLTLVMDEIQPALETATAQVNAWYLDGFSPSQNEAMWADPVFAQIARLSAPDARFATFTAAGFVRRGLAAQGFDVRKVKGFGRKREMLVGELETPPAPEVKAPWYQWGPRSEGNRIAVLGAGIAGATLAHALTRHGNQVTLYDGRGLGSGASGNPEALFMPRLAADQSADGRFHALAYLHMERFLSALPKSEREQLFNRRGVLQVAQSGAETNRFEKLAAEHTLPADHMALLSADEASAQAGIEIDAPTLFFPRSGTLIPQALLHTLTADVPLVSQDIVRWRKQAGEWQLFNEADDLVGTADQLILATGAASNRLPTGKPLPIQPVRGQVSDLPAGSLPLIGPALVRGAYLITGSDGSALTGATFDPRAPFEWAPLPLDADHTRNLDDLKNAFPSLIPALTALSGGQFAGRASYRAQVDDRIPMAGPLPDFDAYETAYDRLRHGDPYAPYPPAPLVPNAYLVGALGARGFTTALLLADLTAAHIAGAPLPLPRDLRDALHPARFTIRKLRKNQI